MTPVNGDIQVERPVAEVFATLVDLAVFDSLWADVSNLQSQDMKISRIDQTFEVTKTIHDRAQQQEFRVKEFEPPRLYEIATTLFKLPVVYRYELVEQGNGATLVSLVKRADLTGWTRVFSPLMRHLFTKPEHDEFHLQRLKELVEDGARPTGKPG